MTAYSGVVAVKVMSKSSPERQHSSWVLKNEEVFIHREDDSRQRNSIFKYIASQSWEALRGPQNLNYVNK